MKALGIDIIANDLCWMGFDGEVDRGQLIWQSQNRLKFPSSASSELGNLIQLKELILAKFASAGFDMIGVVKAGADSKPLRAKCEFVIELACHELDLQCKLISPQTIAAALKRKIATAGGTLESAFNHGVAIEPKYLVRAATCAWCSLS